MFLYGFEVAKVLKIRVSKNILAILMSQLNSNLQFTYKTIIHYSRLLQLSSSGYIFHLPEASISYHVIVLIRILMVARDSNLIHIVWSQKIYVFETKYVFEKSIAPAAQNTSCLWTTCWNGERICWLLAIIYVVEWGLESSRHGFKSQFSHIVPLGSWYITKLWASVFFFHAWNWFEVAQSCPILCDPMDCSLTGSSIHGIFQARILEWVAISFSRRSSQAEQFYERREKTYLLFWKWKWKC